MFHANHIFFLDTKKNMVIDGKFTKIVYSDSVVSLNGLYIYCPIDSSQTSPVNITPSKLAVAGLRPADQKSITNPPELYNIYGQGSFVPGSLLTTNGNGSQDHGSTIITKKIPFVFSLLNPTNIYMIKELNRIEHEIIEHYKEMFQINKTNVYLLRNQLKSGNIKVVHKIPSMTQTTESPSKLENNHLRPIVVKISGIWETDVNIGITFKFQR